MRTADGGALLPPKEKFEKEELRNSKLFKKKTKRSDGKSTITPGD